MKQTLDQFYLLCLNRPVTFLSNLSVREDALHRRCTAFIHSQQRFTLAWFKESFGPTEVWMLPQGLETENSTMIFTEMEKRLAQIASAQKFETAKLLLKKSTFTDWWSRWSDETTFSHVKLVHGRSLRSLVDSFAHLKLIKDENNNRACRLTLHSAQSCHENRVYI